MLHFTSRALGDVRLQCIDGHGIIGNLPHPSIRTITDNDRVTRTSLTNPVAFVVDASASTNLEPLLFDWSLRGPSPDLPIQRSKLNRFADMFGGDRIRSGQIGN